MMRMDDVEQSSVPGVGGNSNASPREDDTTHDQFLQVSLLSRFDTYRASEAWSEQASAETGETSRRKWRRFIICGLFFVAMAVAVLIPLAVSTDKSSSSTTRGSLLIPPQVLIPVSEHPSIAPSHLDGNEETIVLESGTKMRSGTSVFSPNQRYQFEMTNDGDLRLSSSNNDEVLWHIDGGGSEAILSMQWDGNLVFRSSTKSVIWRSKTSEHPGATLRLNNRGRIAVISPDGVTPLWTEEGPPGSTASPTTPRPLPVSDEPTPSPTLAPQSAPPSASPVTPLPQPISAEPTPTPTLAPQSPSPSASPVSTEPTPKPTRVPISTSPSTSPETAIPQPVSSQPTPTPTRIPSSTSPSTSPKIESPEAVTTQPSFVPTTGVPIPTFAPTSPETASPRPVSMQPTPTPTKAPQSAPPSASPEVLVSSTPSRAPVLIAENEAVIILAPDTKLRPGQSMTSPNERFRFELTRGGELKLSTSDGVILWRIRDRSGDTLSMQWDGNLILRTASKAVIWRSNTSQHPDASLRLDNLGRLAVISADGVTPLWMEGVPGGQYDPATASSSMTFPIRGAFYYPWFPETWSAGGKPVFYNPTLGKYSNGDRAVQTAHIEALNYAHVDLAIASWWGQNTKKDRARITNLMDKSIEYGIKWTVYHEQELTLLPEPNAIKKDLDYLKKWFAWHETWGHVDGKPVIFVWNTGDCDVSRRWVLAAGNEWYVVLKRFKDHTECPFQPNHWHEYGPAYAAVHEEGFSFSISPGFWKASERNPRLPRLSEDEFRDNAIAMVESGEPWQLITTFNEWGEGTAVESAREWESSSGNGFYLDVLNEVY